MKNATARQLNFMSEFSTNVRYLEGTKNVADCLSRSTELNVFFKELRPLDFGTMSNEQALIWI